MATSVTEDRPEEEGQVKVPLSLKLIGVYLNVVDRLVYRKDGTVNRKLGAYFNPKIPPKWADGVLTKDVTIDAETGVWARIFEPKEEKAGQDDSKDNHNAKLPVIFYFHGGGFIGLAANSQPYDIFCRKISKKLNAVIISPNYRLAPENRCPTAYDDCFKVFDWLQSPQSRSEVPRKANLSRSFLMGDSAGANIVHFLGCRAVQNDITPTKLRGMIEIQPFFGGEDLTPAEVHLKPSILSVKTCHWAWRAFVPLGDDRDHPNVNVFGPRSPDISGLSLPPILVQIGGYDILKDRQASYVQKLQDMGKDVTMINYRGAHHAFYAIETNQQLCSQFMEDLCNFVRSHNL